jgi:hypothetical protein
LQRRFPDEKRCSGKQKNIQRKTNKIAMFFLIFARIFMGFYKFLMGSLYEEPYPHPIENQVGVKPASLPGGVAIAVPDCCVQLSAKAAVSIRAGLRFRCVFSTSSGSPSGFSPPQL